MTLPQRAGEPIKEGTSTWSYLEKYGVKPSAGGGRSKAREIIGRVAAGTVVRKYLSLLQGVEDDVLETESARNLPPDIAEESPTYVSAEQFHGILKRHVARQKLEADDVDIGKSPQIPSRRGPGRGQRRNNAYWRSQQGNADFVRAFRQLV
jgi:chorismate synthase